MQTVAVARDYICHYVVIGGKSAYYVVRLVSFFFHYGNIHKAKLLLENGKLYCKLVGHMLARGFVPVVHFMAERGRRKVERHGDVFWLIVPDSLYQHGCKSVYSLSGNAVFVIKRRQRVKSAVYKAVAVY